MQYSVIYGHFEKVYCKVGQVLSKGDKIGYMGTTGCSTGVHTHISVVEGYKNWCWSLASMGNGTNKPSKDECLKLLNPSILKGIEPRITNGWLGYKNHYGYDFIGAREVCWSLDVKATVTGIGNLPSKVNGWGNFVVVTYTYEQPKPTKSIDELAKEVIAGKWGNGTDRKNRLTKAGYNYSEVQTKVNEILKGNTKKSVDTIAREVIQGKWGNGKDRKDRLIKAGYNYSEVQARVNQLLKK